MRTLCLSLSLPVKAAGVRKQSEYVTSLDSGKIEVKKDDGTKLAMNETEVTRSLSL